MRRIGGTKYKVRIMFNEEGQETMQDKVLRMIENDLEFTEKAAETGFQKDLDCDTMIVPQMSRPA